MIGRRGKSGQKDELGEGKVGKGYDSSKKSVNVT